ncbi:ABC transporter ATP-binding protein [Nitrospira sp. M1]
MMGELRFLIIDAWRVFGIRVLVLVTLLVISGLLEGIAITVALPLLGSLGVSGPESQSGFKAFLADIPSTLGLPEGPLGVGILMLGFILLSVIAFLAQARLAATLQVEYVVRWQTQLFEASIRSDLAFLSERRGGDVVAALVAEVNRVNGAFYHTCLVVTSIINLVIYLILALLISPVVSLAVVVLGALLFLTTRPYLVRAYGYGRAITRAQADVQSLASEYISAVKLVKAAVAEGVSVERFSTAANQLASFYFKNSFDMQKAKAVFEFGGAAGIASLLIVGPLIFSVDVATLLVVLALFVRLLPRVTALQQGIQAQNSLLPALGNLRTILKSANNLAEPVDELPLPVGIANNAPEIVFRSVTIQRGDRSVLKNINLVVPAGRIVALVGPTGSGKSTLADAILRLVSVHHGEIQISGHDLFELPLPTWRRAIGYVGQDTSLLAGTIADNVRFGNIIADSAIDQALTRAAAQFVQDLDTGKLTPVGDRGMRLSGGERQRLGLARAFAVPRLLYILDEATSALDAETEAQVVETMESLSGKATVLIIAHRFSAVRNADLIYVIEDGRVVESGNWSELDKPGHRFHQLKELQNMTTTNVNV